MEGQAGTNLIVCLETRLDNIIFRMGMAQTRRDARQVVTHGHFLVNGQRVDIPSYRVKVGDVIEVREKSKQLPIVIAAVESSTREVPGYLEVDGKKLTAKYTFTPKLDDIPYGCVMEPNLVIEYYSR